MFASCALFTYNLALALSLARAYSTRAKASARSFSPAKVDEVEPGSAALAAGEVLVDVQGTLSRFVRPEADCAGEMLNALSVLGERERGRCAGSGSGSE